MKHISVIAVLAVMAAAPAFAADLLEPEPIGPEPAPPPAYSGWYIRGDIGYAFKSRSGGDWDFWNIYAPPYRGIDDTLHYDRFSLAGAATVGAGVGYRFNETLRADATLDFFRAGIDGRTNCTSYVKSSHGLNPVEDNCHYEDSSTANVWTPMANVYVDLPAMGAVTPYLGAGIGAAYVKYDDWKTKEVCATCAYQSDKEGLDSLRLATALMAGVSYDMTDQLKLDLGYRYLRIAGGDAYGYDAMDRAGHTMYGDGPGATGTQARDHGFDIHAVRVGLRYDFR